MKRQSVEDYVKERFEMFNYYKENERINKPKDDYVKERFEMNEHTSEHVYVTDEFLLKRYYLDMYTEYEVIFHDEINKDVIGKST